MDKLLDTFGILKVNKEVIRKCKLTTNTELEAVIKSLSTKKTQDQIYPPLNFAYI